MTHSHQSCYSYHSGHSSGSGQHSEGRKKCNRISENYKDSRSGDYDERQKHKGHCNEGSVNIKSATGTRNTPKIYLHRASANGKGFIHAHSYRNDTGRNLDNEMLLMSSTKMRSDGTSPQSSEDDDEMTVVGYVRQNKENQRFAKKKHDVYPVAQNERTKVKSSSRLENISGNTEPTETETLKSGSPNKTEGSKYEGSGCDVLGPILREQDSMFNDLNSDNALKAPKQTLFNGYESEKSNKILGIISRNPNNYLYESGKRTDGVNSALNSKAVRNKDTNVCKNEDCTKTEVHELTNTARALQHSISETAETIETNNYESRVGKNIPRNPLIAERSVKQPGSIAYIKNQIDLSPKPLQFSQSEERESFKRKTDKTFEPTEGIADKDDSDRMGPHQVNVFESLGSSLNKTENKKRNDTDMKIQMPSIDGELVEEDDFCVIDINPTETESTHSQVQNIIYSENHLETTTDTDVHHGFYGLQNKLFSNDSYQTVCELSAKNGSNHNNNVTSLQKSCNSSPEKRSRKHFGERLKKAFKGLEEPLRSKPVKQESRHSNGTEIVKRKTCTEQCRNLISCDDETQSVRKNSALTHDGEISKRKYIDTRKALEKARKSIKVPSNRKIVSPTDKLEVSVALEIKESRKDVPPTQLNGFNLYHLKTLKNLRNVTTTGYLDPQKLYANEPCVMCQICTSYFSPVGFTKHHDSSNISSNIDTEESILNTYKVENPDVLWNKDVLKIWNDFERLFDRERSLMTEIGNCQNRDETNVDKAAEDKADETENHTDEPVTKRRKRSNSVSEPDNRRSKRRKKFESGPVLQTYNDSSSNVKEKTEKKIIDSVPSDSSVVSRLPVASQVTDSRPEFRVPDIPPRQIPTPQPNVFVESYNTVSQAIHTVGETSTNVSSSLNNIVTSPSISAPLTVGISTSTEQDMTVPGTDVQITSVKRNTKDIILNNNQLSASYIDTPNISLNSITSDKESALSNTNYMIEVENKYPSRYGAPISPVDAAILSEDEMLSALWKKFNITVPDSDFCNLLLGYKLQLRSCRRLNQRRVQKWAAISDRTRTDEELRREQDARTELQNQREQIKAKQRKIAELEKRLDDRFRADEHK